MTITAEVTDLDGLDEIEIVTAEVTAPGVEKNLTMVKTQDINNTTATYNGTIQMQFYETAGEYNVTVRTRDSGANNTHSALFEYLSMAAISIDAGSLQFTQVKLGETTSILGDFALSTLDAPSIKNTGNSVLDIGLYGTDMLSGQNEINVENLKYSFDNDFGSVLSGTLGETIQTTDLNLVNDAESVTRMGFQLFVPPATQNGNYTGNVTIVAMSG